MSKALSLDLRVRVLAAVEAGASHREAGDRFGVSAASVSRWRRLAREQGEPRPGPLGGDRRSGRIEAPRRSWRWWRRSRTSLWSTSRPAWPTKE